MYFFDASSRYLYHSWLKLKNNLQWAQHKDSSVQWYIHTRVKTYSHGHMTHETHARHARSSTCVQIDKRKDFYSLLGPFDWKIFLVLYKMSAFERTRFLWYITFSSYCFTFFVFKNQTIDVESRGVEGDEEHPRRQWRRHDSKRHKWEFHGIFFPVGRDLTLPVDIERIRPSGPVGSIVAIPPDGVRTRGPDRPVFSFPWRWIRHCRVSPGRWAGRGACPCAHLPTSPARWPSNLLRLRPSLSTWTEWRWISATFSSSWELPAGRWRVGRRTRPGGWLGWPVLSAKFAPVERHCRWPRWNREPRSRCCKTSPKTLSRCTVYTLLGNTKKKTLVNWRTKQ